jgi:hypothetical protein
MKHFVKQLLSLSMIIVFFLIASVTTAQQPTMQKPPRMKEMQEPLAIKPALLPDLKSNKVWIAKYTPPKTTTQYVPLTGDLTVGEKVYLVCEFSNIGGDLKGNWRIGHYVDGNLVYYQNLGDIPAGHSQNPAGWYIPDKEGTHQYECVLDYERTISEQNKENNKMSIQFKVVKQPIIPKPISQEKPPMTPKSQAKTRDLPPGTVTDEETGYCLIGVPPKLRITNFLINDANGYIAAIVENVGGCLTKDATIRIYIDNVLIKECGLLKSLNKQFCSKYAFDPEDWPLPPQLQKCCWGGGNHEVHVDVFPDVFEPGTTPDSSDIKKGVLHARQDLSVEYFTKDPGNRIKVVFMNRGICDSSTWSYKVRSATWPLIQTSGLLGSIKRGENVIDTLNPQPPEGTESLSVVVVPTYPEHELRSDNNHYSASISYLYFGFHLVVKEIKLIGELLKYDEQFGDSIKTVPGFYTIVPIIKNIGNEDMPRVLLKFETFIDGVSSGEQSCITGLPRQKELWFANFCTTDVILPSGKHTVKFQLKGVGSNPFGANDYLIRTMIRP